MTDMKEFILWTDGGARGNPGPAGYGVVIQDGYGTSVAELSKYLGVMTNNQAEYWGLLAGLTKIRELVKEEPAKILVRMDSELIVKQVQGIYRVKNPALKPLHAQAHELIRDDLGGQVTFEHIPRRENKRADALANRAMDEGDNLVS